MKVSVKNVIEIDKFLFNYVLSLKDFKKFNDKDKICTHDDLSYYLFVNGYKTPDRISFKSIKKSDILSGRVILVRDFSGKIVPYNNPKILNISKLQEELNSEENRKISLKNRRMILKEQGYIEAKNGDIIKEELIDEKEDTITCKINRNKKLINQNIHGMKGRIGVK